MTVVQAIDRSISHSEIVWLDFDFDKQVLLELACDNCTRGNRCFEFWGTKDGHEWRVHMHEARP
jgi:hypothetical protein